MILFLGETCPQCAAVTNRIDPTEIPGLTVLIIPAGWRPENDAGVEALSEADVYDVLSVPALVDVDDRQCVVTDPDEIVELLEAGLTLR